VFRHIGCGKPVSPRTKTFKDSGPHHPRDRFSMHSVGYRVASSEEGARTGKFEDAVASPSRFVCFAAYSH
jgi:hypothetical protein